jgi:hypothetical protein
LRAFDEFRPRFCDDCVGSLFPFNQFWTTRLLLCACGVRPHLLPNTYAEKFRRDAVFRGSGRPSAGVARSLAVSDGTLWNWVTEARDTSERAVDPDALAESEREELKRARRLVIELGTIRKIHHR